MVEYLLSVFGPLNCNRRQLFIYLFIYLFSEKTSLDISCESSAWQTIQMKCQDLFSLKNKKKNECRLLQLLLGALMVKVTLSILTLPSDFCIDAFCRNQWLSKRPNSCAIVNHNVRSKFSVKSTYGYCFCLKLGMGIITYYIKHVESRTVVFLQLVMTILD